MGVTPGAVSQFGIELAFWSRGLEADAVARIRLSKTKHYLVDNVRCTRLSDFRRAVNDKMRWGTNRFGWVCEASCVEIDMDSPESSPSWLVHSRLPPFRKERGRMGHPVLCV